MQVIQMEGNHDVQRRWTGVAVVTGTLAPGAAIASQGVFSSKMMVTGTVGGALSPVAGGAACPDAKNKSKVFQLNAESPVLTSMAHSIFEAFEAQSGHSQTAMNSHHEALPETAKPKAVLPAAPSATTRDPLISLEQAAQQLLMHPKTLERKAREGQVPGRKVANKWRFRALELDAWVDRQTVLQSTNRQPN
jgi:excisionase family DNA binding protein